MAYRSHTQTQSTGTSGVTVNLPAGVQDGDLLTMLVVSDNGSPTPTWPSGFTEYERYEPSMTRLKVVWSATKTAASEGASYSMSFANSSNRYIYLFAHSGRNTTTPVTDGQGTSDASSQSSPVSVSLTGITAAAGDDLIWLGGIDPSSASLGSAFTAPTDYVERAAVGESGAIPWLIHGVATRDNVSSGATGSIAGEWTLSSGTAKDYGYVIALAAGAASGQPTGSRYNGIPGMNLISSRFGRGW